MSEPSKDNEVYLYLTEPQRRVYDYLKSGKPIISQAQMARDCGFDHAQKLVVPLAALVIKGLLKLRPDA